MKRQPIDPSRARGFYYVGYVTQASIDSMPESLREKFPMSAPLSNTIPKATKKAAQAEAEAHHLRDITIIKN